MSPLERLEFVSRCLFEMSFRKHLTQDEATTMRNWATILGYTHTELQAAAGERVTYAAIPPMMEDAH